MSDADLLLVEDQLFENLNRVPLHRPNCDGQRQRPSARLQHPRVLGLEPESIAQQILHAVALLRYTVRSVTHRIGEDMVELVGQYAAQRTPIFFFPILRSELQQPRPQELPKEENSLESHTLPMYLWAHSLVTQLAE